MKAVVRYVSLAHLLLFSCIVWRYTRDNSLDDSKIPSYATLEELFHIEGVLSNDSLEGFRISECTMKKCFNISRCTDQNRFSVYVYPSENEIVSSGEYAKILKVIRESHYYTTDPNAACIFILNIDTIHRDWRSPFYVKNMTELLDALPKDIWNDGRNHLIFSLYHGSFPNYTENDLDFNPGYAMIARPGATTLEFRHNFDIGFPLFYSSHSLRSTAMPVWPLKLNDEFLAVFKGKRYTYGIGSATRQQLHHLNSGKSVLVLTTCKHNINWKKYIDSRCEVDNIEYERYDYGRIMTNSSFCLCPRGRRLGTFRFLESLNMGCVPVSLADDWVMPFSEVIDWSQAVIIAHEYTTLFLSDMLISIPIETIVFMKQQCRALYHRYFNSVEKIVLTSIQIIEERIRRERGQPLTNWNSIFSQGVQFSSSHQKFMAVIRSTTKITGRLSRLIQTLLNFDKVERIIVLWPKQKAERPSTSRFHAKIPIKVFETENDYYDWFRAAEEGAELVTSEFVMFIDERVSFTLDDLGLIAKCSKSEPNRLISFYGALHSNKGGLWNVKIADGASHSIALPYFLVFHRKYISEFSKWAPQPAVTLAHHSSSCFILLLNFMVTELSMRSPVLLSNKVPLDWMNPKSYSFCLQQLVVDLWPSGPSLIESKIRLNLYWFVSPILPSTGTF